MTEIPTFVRLVVFPEVGTFIPHMLQMASFSLALGVK